MRRDGGVRTAAGQRDLYKRAVWAEWQAVPDEVLAADHDAVGAMEQAIADEANVDSDAVVLDVPPDRR